MSSTGEERSLASGIPIPQWMRNKTENHGFDPSALSPPQHEGDFFYIKLPKFQPTEASTLSTVHEVHEPEQAFIRRTESSPQFMSNISDASQVQKPKIIKPVKIDDRFQEEKASCRASVVEVAHQMLGNRNNSFKPFKRGETEGSLAPPNSYLQKRRDSKSLPASPLVSPESSPRTARKSYSRLFGGNLFSTDNLNTSAENIDKKSGSSWILSTLFAAKENGKELIGEGNVVKYDADSKKTVSYKKENSDNFKEPVNAAVEVEPVSSLLSKGNKASILKSKPHLRDLNLLTPSSM